MNKLKVYVHSFGVPTIGFVDKEGAMHACARAQKTAFEGLERFSNIGGGNRYLCDEEREVLMRTKDFCENNGLEFEIVDLGTMGLLARLKMRINGFRTPAISYRGKILSGRLSEEDLQELLKG